MFPTFRSLHPPRLTTVADHSSDPAGYVWAWVILELPKSPKSPAISPPHERQFVVRQYECFIWIGRSTWITPRRASLLSLHTAVTHVFDESPDERLVIIGPHCVPWFAPAMFLARRALNVHRIILCADQPRPALQS